jgi:hypothetical protein
VSVAVILLLQVATAAPPITRILDNDPQMIVVRHIRATLSGSDLAFVKVAPDVVNEIGQAKADRKMPTGLSALKAMYLTMSDLGKRQLGEPWCRKVEPTLVKCELEFEAVGRPNAAYDVLYTFSGDKIIKVRSWFYRDGRPDLG